MKKIFAILTLSLAFSASAQSVLERGDVQFNGGVGFSNWGVPVYAGVDYAITDDITIGGEISYRSNTEKNVFAEWKHSVIGLSVNGNYHFGKLLKLPSNIDVYGGASLAYFNWSSKYNANTGVDSIDNILKYTGNNASGVGFTLQAGGRYFFTEKLGVNIEFGGGTVSGGKAGITYKL